jgi:hypothetical protein
MDYIIVVVIALVLLIASILQAWRKNEQSPLYIAVLGAAVLYIGSAFVALLH